MAAGRRSAFIRTYIGVTGGICTKVCPKTQEQGGLGGGRGIKRAFFREIHGDSQTIHRGPYLRRNFEHLCDHK